MLLYTSITAHVLHVLLYMYYMHYCTCLTCVTVHIYYMYYSSTAHVIHVLLLCTAHSSIYQCLDLHHVVLHLKGGTSGMMLPDSILVS